MASQVLSIENWFYCSRKKENDFTTTECFCKTTLRSTLLAKRQFGRPRLNRPYFSSTYERHIPKRGKLVHRHELLLQAVHFWHHVEYDNGTSALEIVVIMFHWAALPRLNEKQQVFRLPCKNNGR